MKGQIFYRSIATRKEDKSAKGKENVRKIKKTRRKKNDANRSRQPHLALVSRLGRRGQLIHAGITTAITEAQIVPPYSRGALERSKPVGICGRARSDLGGL